MNELNGWTKFRLRYTSTLNTMFNMEMAPAEVEGLGVFIACDYLMNKV
jgi:hypothetical protein